MTRYQKRNPLWTVIASVLLVSLFCLPPQEAASEKIVLKDTWVVNASDAPMALGIEKGFFKAEGIDATMEAGRGSRDNLKLLNAGKLPVVQADSGTAAQFISQGLDARVIYIYYQSSPMSIVAHEDKHIRTAKDLEGKRVGRVPASSNTAMFAAVVGRTGIDTSKIFYINATFATLATAFLRKETDAILLYFPDNVPKLRSKGAKVNYLSFASLGVNTLGEGITASSAFLREKPDTVRGLVRAYTKSFQYTMDNRDEAVAALKRMSPVTVSDEKVARETLDNYLLLLHTKNSKGKPVGWMSEKDWKATIELLTKYAGLKKPLPTDRYFTNQFLP